MALKKLYKDAFGWGFLLWLFGYSFGIVLIKAVPQNLIGWVIMPFGILVTLWVLKKINTESFQQSFLIACVWVLLAVVLDYFLLVRLIKPVDGYYKLDVYLYYLFTFLLPLLFGWKRMRH